MSMVGGTKEGKFDNRRCSLAIVWCCGRKGLGGNAVHDFHVSGGALLLGKKVVLIKKEFVYKGEIFLTSHFSKPFDPAPYPLLWSL